MPSGLRTRRRLGPRSPAPHRFLKGRKPLKRMAPKGEPNAPKRQKPSVKASPNHQCPLCGYKAASKTSLRIYVAKRREKARSKNTGPQRQSGTFTCPLGGSGRLIQERADKDLHESSHRDDNPGAYHCLLETCSYVSNRHQNRNSHEAKHRDKSEGFPCQIGCGLVSGTMDRKKTHEKRCMVQRSNKDSCES